MFLMKSRARVVSCLALVLVFAFAAFSMADSGPRVGPNVQVNAPQQLFPADWPNRNTSSIAAGEEGEELLTVFEDFQGFCGPPNNRPCPAPVPPGLSSFAYSTDRGASWTDGGAIPPINGAQTAGHPWVDQGDKDGEEVFFTASRMRVTVAGNSAGIGVHRGRFANGAFAWESGQILRSPNLGDNNTRPAIAAAKDGSGAAYVAYSNILELCGIPSFGFGQIEVWRTHDGGDTWQGPVIAGPDTAENSDPNDPLCGVAGPLQVAPAVTVGTNGEVYVVWQRGPRFLDVNLNLEPVSAIMFARSLDGGVTFEAPQVLSVINANYENTPVGHGKSRQNDQARIAVATTGRYHGRIYVTYYQPLQQVQVPATQQSAVSSQIYITFSDDQGQTWSAPAAMTPPVPATGIKRFWPTVSVRPGGDVDVVYVESQEKQVTPNPTDVECNVPIGGGLFRSGPLSSLVDTYWIQSQDGGATFSPAVRVSEQTTNWCTTFYTFSGAVFSNIGDYIGSVSAGNRTFVTWPDGRNGFSDVFFAEVKGKAKK
jgi:BNR/Asp-box repeat